MGAGARNNAVYKRRYNAGISETTNGLTADYRQMRGLGAAPRAAPLFSGQPAEAESSARISRSFAENELIRDRFGESAKYIDINFQRERDGDGRERKRIKLASIIPTPILVHRRNRYSTFSHNLFSATLNEALCQHEDNPQDSLTMLHPTGRPPRSSRPAPPRGHITRVCTPTARRVRHPLEPEAILFAILFYAVFGWPTIANKPLN